MKQSNYGFKHAKVCFTVVNDTTLNGNDEELNTHYDILQEKLYSVITSLGGNPYHDLEMEDHEHYIYVIIYVENIDYDKLMLALDKLERE